MPAPPHRTDNLSGTATLRVTRFLILLAAALSALLCPPSAAAQLAPDAGWRTFETANFRVNFMEGLDSLAFRAAARAEWAHELLSRELVEPPSGKIELILADNVDFANGSATPLPTNRITLYAHPPTDVNELAFTTDWLELLVLHELVHIFQLDDASGIWGLLRSALGRNALLFPQANTPSWFVEGLATYYESSLTPAGRVRGTFFEMMLRTAVVEGDFFSIDRASGNPRSWPGGSTRYVYGSVFLDFVARRHGAAAMSNFVRIFGGQTIPYRIDAAARRAFGTSFTAAWSAWTDTLRVNYEAEAAAVAARGLTDPEILTAAGRDAYQPRYAPDSERIVYSSATGRDQPGLHLLDAAGAEREVRARAAMGPVSWTPDGAALIHGDLEFHGPYRIFSDLRRTGVGGGDRRITRGARIAQPDLHPDGRTLVAVRDVGGTNVLVVGDPEIGELREVTTPSLDVYWAYPRWSPRGDRIAAIGWAPGGMHDLVLLDADGRLVGELTHDRAVEGTPSWSPDGRYLLFWSDRTGIPNLFAHDLEQDRLLQVTNVVSGAIDPDVSPDGRWIAFSYYRADGFHIARIPFDPSRWTPAAPPRPEALPLDTLRRHAPLVATVRRYSPWPSVAPAAWTLLANEGTALGLGAGARLDGVDAVRRHLWAAEGLVYADGGRFEGGAAYRYQGWGNPAIELAASQQWSVACEAASLTCGGDEPLPTAVLRRDREASLSLLWVRQRVRSTAWLRPGVGVEKRDLRWDEPELAGDLGFRRVPADLAARLELGRSSVRAFELSVGPQAGFSIVSAAEGHRFIRAIDEDAGPGGYARLTERGRAYRSIELGGTPHVLALRADLGMEFGSRSPGFDVGGASGGSLPIALEVDVFGRGISFPIRGYPEGVQFGNRAFTASAEYRFPLLRVERGVGVIPVYLDRITGDVFTDVGSAWCPGDCPVRLAAAPSEPRPLPSVGAELLVDLRFGFHTAVPVRMGVAAPLRDGREPRLYLRVGRAF